MIYEESPVSSEVYDFLKKLWFRYIYYLF
jgi:hypothetical protein